MDAKKAVIVEETGTGLFQVRVDAPGASFFADEPEAVGGLASGPDPFDLVCAAIASCTVMTMRLYARRKGWDISTLSAEVSHSRTSPNAAHNFEISVNLDSDLDEEKRERLLYIARHCPVHQMLDQGAELNVGAAATPFSASSRLDLHAGLMEKLCASIEASR